ncbi:hypothetical protein [Vibrio sp. SCSIO 43136]|uniref:hypothetical protein n=1 Tax=Vibrio sp. SCSIO 43136 TaxID=2819101 RepID=UPI0020766686|nr:hypothetical protein [Vibrio sp. SCSIO 43136]USD67247.1 hypothetical protein J4N39_21685 [Vibrio sp. SCSIO 43136]
MKKLILASLVATTMTGATYAEEKQELADMSDPMAVFTSVGAGYTDKGLNLKYTQAFDSGNPTQMALRAIEVKGIGGDAIGWSEDATDSVSELRFRDFRVDMANGRGGQVDLNWNIEAQQGTASYSLMQALPKIGPVQFFPLAGVGFAVGEELSLEGSHGEAELRDRIDMHGTFYIAGMYAKLEITDKIWLNYNPMYMGTMSGSDAFKNSYFLGDDTVLNHEFIASYQVNPRLNFRYFANWNNSDQKSGSFDKGDHRIEFNYQL